MNDLLFDAPLWLMGIVAIVGIVVFVSGNRRTEPKTRNVGLGLVGLAVLLLLLRWLVDTPGKIALRESRELAASVEAGDWKKFRSLLASDASLRVLRSHPIYNSAAQVAVAAQAGAEGVHLRAVHIRSAVAEQSGPLVTVTMNLFTEQDQAGLPLLESAWQFDFKNTSEGWRVGEIRAIKIGDLSPDEIEQQLPKIR